MSLLSFYPSKEIIPGLFIGSEGDSINGKGLAAKNVGLVVNCSKNIKFSHENSVRHIRVPIDDNPTNNPVLYRYLPTIVRAIDSVLELKKGVMVHCRAGMQRSASVVAAYLMWKYNWSKAQAIAYIKNKKGETFWPYPTFDETLSQWEQRGAANVRTSNAPNAANAMGTKMTNMANAMGTNVSNAEPRTPRGQNASAPTTFQRV